MPLWVFFVRFFFFLFASVCCLPIKSHPISPQCTYLRTSVRFEELRPIPVVTGLIYPRRGTQSTHKFFHTNVDTYIHTCIHTSNHRIHTSVAYACGAPQISKKKLERVAVQGGDFGKAGRRTYGEMTVPHLRKLLEDDVEDLAKRALCPEVSSSSLRAWVGGFRVRGLDGAPGKNFLAFRALWCGLALNIW